MKKIMIINTVHPSICGFPKIRPKIFSKSFVHKSGERPQIESVGD